MRFPKHSDLTGEDSISLSGQNLCQRVKCQLSTLRSGRQESVCLVTQDKISPRPGAAHLFFGFLLQKVFSKRSQNGADVQKRNLHLNISPQAADSSMVIGK